MNGEIQDSFCKCYSGRMTRLVNSINGFTSLVNIKINDADQIYYIVSIAQKKYPDDLEKQKQYFVQEMEERGYPDFTIEEWSVGFSV